MARAIIATGSAGNDGTGDTLRQGAIKINANFAELFQDVGALKLQTADSVGGLDIEGISFDQYGVVFIGEDSIGGSPSPAIAISGVNATLNPVLVTTSTSHGYSTGQYIEITNVVGSTELNGNKYFINVISNTEFTLFTDKARTVTVDGATISAYTSGGIVKRAGNAWETILKPVEPSQDNTLLLPDSSGTIALLADLSGFLDSTTATQLVRNEILDSAKVIALVEREAVDSTAVANIVNTAYIEARVTLGIDSTAAIGIVQDQVDSSFIDTVINPRQFLDSVHGNYLISNTLANLTSDLAPSISGGADLGTISHPFGTVNTSFINASEITLSDNFVIENYAQDSESIVFTNLRKIRFNGGTDSGEIAFTSDSYGDKFTITSTVVPTVDDYRDLGDSAERWKDLYLSNSINIGATNSMATITETGGIIDMPAGTTVGGKEILDSALATQIIDSAYVQIRAPESYLSTIIDSTYVQIRVPESYLSTIIDSAYIEPRTKHAAYIEFGYDASASSHTDTVMFSTNGSSPPNGKAMPVDGKVTHITSSFQVTSYPGSSRTVWLELYKDGVDTGIDASVETYGTGSYTINTAVDHSYSASNRLELRLSQDNTDLTTANHAALIRIEED